jgi:hypothetical protein
MKSLQELSFCEEAYCRKNAAAENSIGAIKIFDFLLT